MTKASLIIGFFNVYKTLVKRIFQINIFLKKSLFVIAMIIVDWQGELSVLKVDAHIDFKWVNIVAYVLIYLFFFDELYTFFAYPLFV